MPNLDEIRATLKQHSQDHLLATWDTLDQNGQQRLLEDLARIDFAWIEARRKDLTSGAAGAGGEIFPAPVVELPKTDADRQQFAKARAVGEEALRQGKAAALLVAGGQGTRLGFNGPKGAFPVGPISGRTLFQWHAEQILARSNRYRSVIPWYIMTSRENDADTKAFFEQHDYFGLARENVCFFQQDMVPCLDLDGNMLLADVDRVAMNPNGHGGSLFGLRSSGALDDMRRRGVEYISYFQVDNPLVTICDPVFIGLHILAGSEMSSKVLQKAAPDERIGVACIQDGKPTVVEYI
ncbi:MAG: UTP--glucose-1-phosphate uridylyltransferase, partial [Planctomycetes bacterium]|nr:UTP--glucose-1-phosphate uridylyltransferase [Planctomycetota bacterium]